MANNKKIDFALMEGQTFIVGREGHIFINSPKVSKYHAELKIVNGKVHLRDMNSTNGTYLVKNEELVHFSEGWVHEQQIIMIGDERRLVQSLLAIAVGFCDEDDTVSINHAAAFNAASQSSERRLMSRKPMVRH
jgi:pSer/pThr/pTyr-binding forkhead associated (FHA) protein